MSIKNATSRISLLIFVMVMFCFVSGQGENLIPPAAIKQKVLELYPNATALNWETERNGYEAEFTSNGQDVEVSIDSKGTIREIEQEINLTDLPATVHANFQKKNSGYKVTKVARRWYGGVNEYSLVALSTSTREHFIFEENGNLKSHRVIEKDRLISKTKAPNKITPAAEKKIDYKQNWSLPVMLTEVSGIAFVNAILMACVQDELGSLFLYDLQSNRIVSEIEFSGPGDYEGIAIVRENAYVLRSDGLLYEILNYRSANLKVNQYALELPKREQNFEGLCYDQKSSRLLIAPRAFDTEQTDTKGIYAFDLASRTFSNKPVLSINLKDQIFQNSKRRAKNEVFIPSEIAIHPVTDEIYLTDARNKQVLVMNRSGKALSLYPLHSSMFPKTEGIAFSSTGEIFLSNEGKNSRPNILRLSTQDLK